MDSTLWSEVAVNGRKVTVETSTIVPVIVETSLAVDPNPKEKCALCLYSYAKSSVKFCVPNHRIISLQRSWGYNRTGKRYENAAFLYSKSYVCVFCSQLFSDTNEINSTQKLKIEVKDEPTIKEKISHIAPKSQIDRNDLAYNQKAYQSSTADEFEANIANNKLLSFKDSNFNGTQYNVLTDCEDIKSTRTRREVDPWWEVYLGSTRNIHSIKLAISAVIHFKLFINIMVLPEVLGFEDPFLDSVVKKAVAWKEFIIPENYQSKRIELFWELPPKSLGSAIRVQLRGIQTLSIAYLHAFQGDEIPNDTSNKTNESYDRSFATISPKHIEQGLLDMMSANDRRNRMMKTSNEKPKQKFDRVDNFSTHIESRYRTIQVWADRVLEHCSLFYNSEVVVMYRQIFLPAVEGSFGGNNSTQFEEKLLMSEALSHRFPKSDLNEFLNRLKTILRWVQARSHTKLLGSLMFCESFCAIANDSDDHLYKLGNEIKKIQAHWEKAALENPDITGISWSQSILLIALLCKQRPYRIPYLVFGIGEDIESIDEDDLGSRRSSISGNLTPSLHGGSNSSLHSLLEGGSNRSKKLLNTSVSLDGTNSMFAIEDKKTQEVGPLLKAVRTKQLLFAPSDFSKFKLSMMTRKVSNYEEFPKELSLDFAKTLIPSKSPTKSSMAHNYSNSDGIALSKSLPNINLSSSRPVSQSSHSNAANRTDQLPSSTSNASMFSQYMNHGGRGGGGDDDDDEDCIAFHRVCSLCSFKFPRMDNEIRVLWKHVIRLRRNWDSKLVSKEIELLDHTVSMYNLVPVCVFCAQYFDPDFDGGIAFPQKESKKGAMSVIAASDANTIATELVPFFDGRFPLPSFANNSTQTQLCNESREKARRATAVYLSMQENNSNNNSNNNSINNNV